MGFIEYWFKECDEENCMKELSEIKKLRKTIAKNIETLKNGHITNEDGSRKHYWEIETWTRGKRYAYKTKEDWVMDILKELMNEQTDLMTDLDLIKKSWLRYVEKTGDTDLEWNRALEIFPDDELYRDLDPDDEFLKEKYPKIWLKGEMEL